MVDQVKGRVFVIKVAEKEFRADISFDNDVSKGNTEWARQLVAEHPKLAVLNRLVKLWAQRRALPDGRSSGISSHGWFVLLVHAMRKKLVDLQGTSLLEALRTFFGYYLEEFNYETDVASPDPAAFSRSKSDWDRLKKPFILNGPYPKSLAIVDTVETDRNLTLWLPPAFLLLTQAEIRRAASLLSDVTAAKIHTLFEQAPSMKSQIAEDHFYLALCSEATPPIRIAYARLVWSGPRKSHVSSSVAAAADPNKPTCHLKACRWNSNNVVISWRLYDIVSRSDGKAAINRIETSPTIQPKDILCPLDHPPRISPPPRTIDIPLKEIARIDSLATEFQRRSVQFHFNAQTDLIDKDNDTAPEAQAVKRRRR